MFLVVDVVYRHNLEKEKNCSVRKLRKQHVLTNISFISLVHGASAEMAGCFVKMVLEN